MPRTVWWKCLSSNCSWSSTTGGDLTPHRAGERRKKCHGPLESGEESVGDLRGSSSGCAWPPPSAPRLLLYCSPTVDSNNRGIHIEVPCSYLISGTTPLSDAGIPENALMSSWFINCNTCGHVTNPGTIHRLVLHCNEDGWFVCSKCKQRGHIKTTFQRQENEVDTETQPQEPYFLGLCGIMRQDMKDRDRSYYPFAFWMGSRPKAPATRIWFCYYKDTRTLKEKSRREGNLEMDHGYSGPPVHDFKKYTELIAALHGGDEADVDIIVERNGRLTVIDREAI